MVKFAHISNYSNLMRFTIFKCGYGYNQYFSHNHNNLIINKSS